MMNTRQREESLQKREEKIIRLGSYMTSDGNYEKVMQSVNCLKLLSDLRLRDANISIEQRYKLLYEREKWINNLRSSN